MRTLGCPARNIASWKQKVLPTKTKDAYDAYDVSCVFLVWSFSVFFWLHFSQKFQGMTFLYLGVSCRRVGLMMSPRGATSELHNFSAPVRCKISTSKRAIFLLGENNPFDVSCAVISQNHESSSMFGRLIFEALPPSTSYSNHKGVIVTACVLEFFTFKVEMTWSPPKENRIHQMTKQGQKVTCFLKIWMK